MAMDHSCTRVNAEDPKVMDWFRFLTESSIVWFIDITPIIPGTLTSSVRIQAMVSYLPLLEALGLDDVRV